jgi:hypothetical protein
MHVSRRPHRHDWIAGLAAGASLGFVFLGVGGRVGMRAIALASDQAPSFTIEGSIAVCLLGAVTGAVVATVFLLVRTAFPTRRWTRGVLFWTVCGALVLRGLHPVTALNAAVFVPLFLLHGVLLHAFWCRIHLARRVHAEARNA